MTFTPRETSDITSQMAAVVVAQSALSDVAEGSEVVALLDAMANVVAQAERDMAAIASSFSLVDVAGRPLRGRLLDERCATLPRGGVARLEGSPAAGAAIQVTRTSSSGAYTIPAGTTFGRDDSSVVYVSTTTQIMADGEAVYPPSAAVEPLHVVATTRGADTNAPDPGTVSRLVSGPDGILSVTSIRAIGGGSDREDDAALFRRAMAYMEGLGRVQAGFARFLALSHQSALGGRVRFASVFEDPRWPAYAELLIDDGSGFGGYSRQMVAIEAVVPDNGQTTLYHEFPATAPIVTIEIDKGSGFVAYGLGDASGAPRWTSVPERGVVYVHDPTLLDPGDSWRIGGRPEQRVYTGPIAEIQAVIEGSPDSPGAVPGYRTRGGRLRVMPPTPTYLAVTAIAVWEAGTNIATARALLQSALDAYVRTLGPGEPLFLSRATHEAHKAMRSLLSSSSPDGALRKIEFTAPSADFYPASNRHVVRPSSVEVS